MSPVSYRLTLIVSKIIEDDLFRQIPFHLFEHDHSEHRDHKLKATSDWLAECTGLKHTFCPATFVGILFCFFRRLGTFVDIYLTNLGSGKSKVRVQLYRWYSLLLAVSIDARINAVPRCNSPTKSYETNSPNCKVLAHLDPSYAEG
jgi:hypothetical protein